MDRDSGMTVHEEHSRRFDDLWAYWEGLGTRVNSTLDVDRIARRELMAKYIAQGKPEALIPLLDEPMCELDIEDIETVAIALAERKRFDAACRLWERILAEMEKTYWQGLRTFRRKHPSGSAGDVDPQGERVFLYERLRVFLALAFNKYATLIFIHGGRSGARLAKALGVRRQRIFSEALPVRKITPDARAMTEEVFWNLIESCGPARESTDDRVEALRDRLSGFRPKEILQFGKLLRKRLKESNKWDLWGAGYLLNAGCSDDGFPAFCAWLILQGRARFENGVRDADTLASWARPTEADPAECEELIYLADEVYEEATGKDSPSAEVEGGDPKGKRWTENDLPTRLPKLWKAMQ
jgi:Protein of unknown function (DUF4240)